MAVSSAIQSCPLPMPVIEGWAEIIFLSQDKISKHVYSVNGKTFGVLLWMEMQTFAMLNSTALAYR